MDKNLKFILSTIVLIAAGYLVFCFFAQHSEKTGVVVQGGPKKDNGKNCGNSTECKSGYCYGKNGINPKCQDKPV